LKNFNRHVTN